MKVQRKVVVTGLGMLTPVGNDVTETWANILAGKSGIAPIEHFDASTLSTRFCGAIKNFDTARYFDTKEARKMDLFIQYGIAAAVEAIEDAKLLVNSENAHRIGVAIGSGIGGLPMIEDNARILIKSGPRRISPFFVPGSIINMVAGNLAIRYGFMGPNFAITTACTTGTHNIGYGARTIACNDADVMICGGSEMASCQLGIGGFAAVRALSTRNEDPQTASRPWDKDRDGFVLSDGAGVVVLEEYEHAKARNATIYAELVGFGMSDDAYHMTAPNGIGAEKAMLNAIENANIHPDQIQYINAHATSTYAGDLVESQAIERIFAENAKKIAVSSTKSMIGHLLGAAGAVEAIFCVLALRDQIAPPTINLQHLDEGCNLDYVPNQARAMKIQCALSNSFGFGGTNASLIFAKMAN